VPIDRVRVLGAADHSGTTRAPIGTREEREASRDDVRMSEAANRPDGDPSARSPAAEHRSIGGFGPTKARSCRADASPGGEAAQQFRACRVVR
jgi:hypothetical protein